MGSAFACCGLLRVRLLFRLQVDPKWSGADPFRPWRCASWRCTNQASGTTVGCARCALLSSFACCRVSYPATHRRPHPSLRRGRMGSSFACCGLLRVLLLFRLQVDPKWSGTFPFRPWHCAWWRCTNQASGTTVGCTRCALLSSFACCSLHLLF